MQFIALAYVKHGEFAKIAGIVNCCGAFGVFM
jgi:hypothetical protein